MSLAKITQIIGRGVFGPRQRHRYGPHHPGALHEVRHVRRVGRVSFLRHAQERRRHRQGASAQRAAFQGRLRSFSAARIFGCGSSREHAPAGDPEVWLSRRGRGKFCRNIFRQLHHARHPVAWRQAARTSRRSPRRSRPIRKVGIVVDIAAQEIRFGGAKR